MPQITRRQCAVVSLTLIVGVVVLTFSAAAEDTAPNALGVTDVSPPEDFDDDYNAIEAPELPPPEGAKALPEPDRVWVDVKRGHVFIDGFVSLREGYLEMFACLEGTKEHESVVAVRSRAFVIHAALLSVGAETGRPVQFRPKYAPPTGTEIDIEVRWIDEQGKWQKARAQDWVLDMETEKPMDEKWVFAGSGFYTDESTGKRYYMAEGGDLICVSNFTTATLDIPVESTQQNDGLLFEANTAKIPPLGMPVRLVLTPKLKDKANAGDEERGGATRTEPRAGRP